MKKFTAFLALLLAINYGPQTAEPDQKELYRSVLNHHPFNLREKLTPADLKKIPKEDRPDLAWEQDFLATMDPQLGRPAPERLIQVYQQMQAQQASLLSLPGSAGTPWVERGPANVGGRTRALMFDPNDSTYKKVWAGGVSGGLWYNSDITSASSAWVAVNDFWDNIAISAIAFDPTNTQVMYVGTGEGWGAGSGRGAGIWKSTNGGQSWSHLTATSNFHYVHDLVVRNENGNGVLYVALRNQYYGSQWHGGSSQGLQRSTNGGTSFSQVLPNVPGQSYNYAAGDLEIGADNTLWVGTRDASYGDGGGTILKSTNGTSFSAVYTNAAADRVELACAPSDANYVYAVIESGNVVDEIIRTTNKGINWSACTEPADADNGIPNSDFSRGQAWYDLIAAVDPNNRESLIVGGVDLFRSTNGGSSWDQISKWSNNNNLFSLNCSMVHADQHAIEFRPGSSGTVIFGNDGGVFYSSNIASAATSSQIHARNNGYNVTQFYACAIHPQAGNNYFLAGAQDNGSQQFNGIGINNTTRVTGGDGAFCFIDQTDANYQITSYVYNNFWLSTNGGLSFPYPRVLNDNSTGRFINPADYDDQMNILYSARTSSTVMRLKNITSLPTDDYISISGMSSMASHLRVSPYTTTSTTLFVGTEAGDLYKVTNADGSPSTTSIGSALPAGRISCVEIGASENELLVTLSNYGITSVWYTSNGGSSWVSKEGNLPDMPVRWALFNPNDRDEVILATEVGVWGTTNLAASSPNWTASNSGLSNVRVDMLQIRDSDHEVIASTFGRGLFSSSGFNNQVLAADFSADITQSCEGDTVTFSDLSSGTPTSWQWYFSPASVTYVNGTSSSSQNPQVVFGGNGSYDVKLVISAASGTDSLSKQAYLQHLSAPQISFNSSLPVANLCKTDVVSLSATPSGGSWSGPGVSGGQFIAAQAGDGLHAVIYSVSYGSTCTVSDTFMLAVDIVPKPTITRSGNTLTCNQAGYSYQWLKDGQPVNGGNGQSLLVSANGSYAVQIGTGSCFDVSDGSTVNDIGMEELKAELGFSLYPNPSQGLVQFSFNNPGSQPAHWALCDLSGKQLQQGQLSSDPNSTAEADLSNLPAGIYLLKVVAGEIQISEKLIRP